MRRSIRPKGQGNRSTLRSITPTRPQGDRSTLRSTLPKHADVSGIRQAVP